MSYFTTIAIVHSFTVTERNKILFACIIFAVLLHTFLL